MSTITIKPGTYHIGRVCEICGHATNGPEAHICNECREKIRNLIGLKGEDRSDSKGSTFGEWVFISGSSDSTGDAGPVEASPS